MSWTLTRQADQDLVDIYMYGAREFGIDQADAYHAELERVFASLGEFPRLARLRTEFSPPVRIHPHKAHLVFYVKQDSGILIVRVRHGSEDWTADVEN